jgi:pimeloyl-ACP methyl ester carboxylesterase
MLTRRSLTASFLAGSAAMVASSATSAKATTILARKSSLAGNSAFQTHYRAVDIDGISIFYREAGALGAPVVLLLHGWPSSSAMFRDLIRELSANYHIFAPDYPGFGNSDSPDRSRFHYTFDGLGEVIGRFVDKVGIGQYVLYATDFGGLVGYRVMLKSPHRMKALVAQNNPLFPSASPWFGPLVSYWKDGTAESRQKAAEHYLPRRGSRSVRHRCTRYIPDRSGTVAIRIFLAATAGCRRYIARSALRYPHQRSHAQGGSGLPAFTETADAGCQREERYFVRE